MEQRPGTPDDVLSRIDAIPVGGSAQAMREAFARLAGPQPITDAIRLGNGEALVVGEGPTLVWFHGGGLVFGSPETHVVMAMVLAATGLRVVLPRYRLAPEHRWPAMLEDAADAVDAARANGPVVIGGISAGGHLALAVARRNPSAVAGIALISPNTDRTWRSDTRKALSSVDAMNDDASDSSLAAMALGTADRTDPEVSPALAELTGLPPLHVEVGSCEVLLGDSLELVRRTAIDGVPASLHVTVGSFHMAALWPDALPKAREQLARIGAFARQALS